MRKIEAQILAAVKAGMPGAYGNTTITTGLGLAVYLHGHRIAYTPLGTTALAIDYDTLTKWPTKLTKSRLHLLGLNPDSPVKIPTLKVPR